LPPQSVLVIYDDMDVGKIAYAYLVQLGGTMAKARSHTLATKIPRLRIGIDPKVQAQVMTQLPSLHALRTQPKPS